jgi:hypothetical protein
MKEKKSCLLVLNISLFLWVGLSLTVLQTQAAEPPLPNDVKIIPPSPDLPKEIAAFSGKWVGEWNIGLSSILIIEEINEKEAKVIYSVGDYPRMGIQANYKRYTAKVLSRAKPRIEFTTELSALIFEMKDQNNLEGVSTHQRGERNLKFVITMKRVN